MLIVEQNMLTSSPESHFLSKDSSSQSMAQESHYVAAESTSCTALACSSASSLLDNF